MFQARTPLTELSFFGTKGVRLSVMDEAKSGRVSRRESRGTVKEARRSGGSFRKPGLLLILCKESRQTRRRVNSTMSNTSSTMPSPPLG